MSKIDVFHDPSLLSQWGAVLIVAVEVLVLGQCGPVCTHGYIWLKLALISWVGLSSPFLCTPGLQNACQEEPKGSCQGKKSKAAAGRGGWGSGDFINWPPSWRFQEFDEVQSFWSLQEGFTCTLYIYHSSVRRRSIQCLSWVRRCHGPWHLLANVLSTPPLSISSCM